MANANMSWMPAKGRHRVEIGSSLARYLKSRKLNNGEGSATTGKRSHLPDKDFYSFKYKHKPPSMDTKKAGMIQFEQSATHPVLLEHPSVQPGESVMFGGKDQPLREGDCVLIIDEDTGTFTLEKLEACVNLTYERGLPSIMPRTVSPTPSTSTPTPRGTSNEYTRDDIDREISNLVGDDGPPVTTKRTKRAPPPQEEEEEEGEGEDDDDFPVPSRSPPRQKQQPKATPPAPAAASSRPVKPMPKARPKASPPQAPIPAPTTRAEVPPRRNSPPQPKYEEDSDEDEADVPLSKTLPPKPPVTAKPPVSARPTSPAKAPVVVKPPPPPSPSRPPVSAKPPTPTKPPAPTKPMGIAFPSKSSVQRPGVKKQAPPPPPPQVPASTGLALPGSSSAQTILPSALPRPGSSKPPPPEPLVNDVFEDSDSDDGKWEEVTATHTVNPTPQSEPSQQISEEEMEDIFGGMDEVGDEDDFGKQLELEMQLADGLAEEDDEDDDDMEPVPIPEATGPISLHALAGGDMNSTGFSDDDYSSSDDSDEDD